MRWTAAFILAAIAAPLQAAPVEYTVRWEPEPHTLRVAVCVEPAAARRVFRAHHYMAPEFLREAARRSGGTLARGRDELVAEGWEAGECLDYRVDARRLGEAGDAGNGRHKGEELLTSPRAWLWRPVDLAMEADATIHFVLPAGWRVSVPWEPVGDDPAGQRYRLGATTPRWPALVAFGRFEEKRLDVGARGLRLALLGKPTAAQADALARFVEVSGRDMSQSFPLAFAHSPQVAVIPVGAQGDPVPFGQSLRGGGTALVLFIDQTRPLADYLGNWTLAHELVHLVHPYLGDEGRWISEGLATYYQSVVRARAGRITPAQAWEKLDAGFGRGRANPSPLTLRQTSEQMGRGLYMRGYWSGTALVLMADLALRTRAASPTSLDAVLNRYLECCRDDHASRRPREFLAALERIAGEPVFAPLYDAHADEVAFPDLAGAYRTLGISVEGDTLRFSDDAEAVRLRTAIMGGD